MKEIPVEDIIEKYIGGSASDDELTQLNSWYDSFDTQAPLYVAETPELTQVLSTKFAELKAQLLID